jgi:hypothetical protein
MTTGSRTKRGTIQTPPTDFSGIPTHANAVPHPTVVGEVGLFSPAVYQKTSMVRATRVLIPMASSATTIASSGSMYA